MICGTGKWYYTMSDCNRIKRQTVVDRTRHLKADEHHLSTMQVWG